jgi:putative signal transducing protein
MRPWQHKVGHRIIQLTVATNTNPDADQHREPTMIRRFRDLPEALLAKTSLESAGIDCFLADDNIVRMDWFWSNLLGGVKLFVDAKDAEAAVSILEQPGPDRFDVSEIGQYERPRCPQCNSVDIHLDELRALAYVSAYFGIPIPLRRDGWKCHSCGHQWRKDENMDA